MGQAELERLAEQIRRDSLATRAVSRQDQAKRAADEVERKLRQAVPVSRKIGFTYDWLRRLVEGAMTYRFPTLPEVTDAVQTMADAGDPDAGELAKILQEYRAQNPPAPPTGESTQSEDAVAPTGGLEQSEHKADFDDVIKSVYDSREVAETYAELGRRDNLLKRLGLWVTYPNNAPDDNRPAYFDAVVTHRNASIVAVNFDYESVAEMVKAPKDGAAILNVGSGLSDVGRVMATARPDLDYTDFDWDFADQEFLAEWSIGSVPKNHHAVAGDALRLTEAFPDGTQFDEIHSLWLLPHLSLDNDAPAKLALEQMFAMLKPGGRLIVGPRRRFSSVPLPDGVRFPSKKNDKRVKSVNRPLVIDDFDPERIPEYVECLVNETRSFGDDETHQRHENRRHQGGRVGLFYADRGQWGRYLRAQARRTRRPRPANTEGGRPARNDRLRK